MIGGFDHPWALVPIIAVGVLIHHLSSYTSARDLANRLSAWLMGAWILLGYASHVPGVGGVIG